MIRRMTQDYKHYPNQFWLMFLGMAIATTGTAMIWPFLMIYASETLSLPLVAVASLMTINATMAIISSILAGPVVDRVGRKWVMVIGLLGAGLGYFLLSNAHSYGTFAVILGLSGVFSPLYNVGSDAMLADLFSEEKRADAFALIRMARNIGVAAGPALGGFVLARSYQLGLFGAAAGLTAYGLLILIFARETMPAESEVEKSTLLQQMQGYWTALRDKPFMGLVGSFTLVQMTTAMIWVLLSVYVKTNFGLGESLYGWLPTTNALMVVFFQVMVTRRTSQIPALKLMHWGAGFYIITPLLVVLATGFWGFWLAMVMMTLGELVMVPRTSAYAANLAPVTMRGRYLSLYGLTWSAAAGISPVLGGFLSDTVGPKAPWLAGVLFGVLAVWAFGRLNQRKTSEPQATS